MPRPEKPALVKWLYRREFERPFQIREIVAEGAQAELGKSPDQAEAYSEANANPFWGYLLARQDEDRHRGLVQPFQILDSVGKTLAWYGLGDPRPVSPLTRRLQFRLRHRPSLLRMIDGLDDRRYEALGCVVSQMAGATHVLLTPPKDEGGIDFFALLPAPGRCHLFAGGAYPLRVVGQCKKHSNAVQVDQVKGFLQTLDDVKHRGEQKIERLVPPWFHAARGPIVGLLIGHSGFQDGASRKARNHGVIAADSLDLAEIMALSRQIPEILPSPARVEMCERRIQYVLDNLTPPANSGSPHRLHAARQVVPPSL